MMSGSAKPKRIINVSVRLELLTTENEFGATKISLHSNDIQFLELYKKELLKQGYEIRDSTESEFYIILNKKVPKKPINLEKLGHVLCKKLGYSDIELQFTTKKDAYDQYSKDVSEHEDFYQSILNMIKDHGKGQMYHFTLSGGGSKLTKRDLKQEWMSKGAAKVHELIYETLSLQNPIARQCAIHELPEKINKLLKKKQKPSHGWFFRWGKRHETTALLYSKILEKVNNIKNTNTFTTIVHEVRERREREIREEQREREEHRAEQEKERQRREREKKEQGKENIGHKQDPDKQQKEELQTYADFYQSILNMINDHRKGQTPRFILDSSGSSKLTKDKGSERMSRGAEKVYELISQVLDIENPIAKKRAIIGLPEKIRKLLEKRQKPSRGWFFLWGKRHETTARLYRDILKRVNNIKNTNTFQTIVSEVRERRKREEQENIEKMKNIEHKEMK